jgi:hypothetical protein
VANRQLPYENLLGELFEHRETLVEQDGFKVIHARRPQVKAALQPPRRGKGRR